MLEKVRTFYNGNTDTCHFDANFNLWKRGRGEREGILQKCFGRQKNSAHI